MRISFEQFLSTRTFYQNLAEGPATLPQGPAVWAGVSGYVYLDQLIAEVVGDSYRPRAGEWSRDGMPLDAAETRLYAWACEHGLCDLDPAQVRREAPRATYPRVALVAQQRFLYFGEEYVGAAKTPELAAELVRRWNALPGLVAAVEPIIRSGEVAPAVALRLDAAYQRAAGEAS